MKSYSSRDVIKILKADAGTKLIAQVTITSSSTQ